MIGMKWSCDTWKQIVRETLIYIDAATADEKRYHHNIFTQYFYIQQILRGKILLIVIIEKKSILNVKLKFELIITNNL